MGYMESMKAACQAANEEASSLLSSAEKAIDGMVTASQGYSYAGSANQAYAVTTTLPTLPTLDTDLGVDPAALANELTHLSPELPGAYRAILSEKFPAEDFASLEAQFEQFLAPAFLDAQRAMTLGRLERELASKRRELLSAYTARGFSSAPGALLGAVSELEASDHDKRVELSQQLYTQNLDKWFEYSQFLVRSYLDARKAEIEAFVKLTEAYISSYLNLRIKGVELVAQLAETLADLRMKAFGAEAERAKLSVQLEQLKLGAWEASSKERIQYTLANVNSSNQNTALRTNALDSAARSYANIVAGILSQNTNVMVAQGIGND